MDVEPSEFGTTLRDNIGALFLVLAIFVYQISKTYYKTIEKKLRVKYYKYTSPERTYIDISKDSSRSSNSHYLRVRHLGGTYLVIKSSSLAAEITRDLDNFEDNSFPSRTFKISLNLLSVPIDGAKTFKKFLNLITRRRHPAIDLPPKKHPLTTTEIQTRPPASEPVKFTSKTDRNAELLLPGEHSLAKKSKPTLQECYSQCDLQRRQFTLMKVPAIPDTRLMNSNNTLIKSPLILSSDTDDQSSPYTLYERSFPLIKYCVKELAVLLEAKSNRKDTINVKPFCYKHAVNILGVCVFGKSINELTSSKCQFYRVCDDLVDILGNERKNKINRYVTQILRRIQSENENEKIQRIVGFFVTIVEDGLSARNEADENCLLKCLLEQFSDQLSDLKCNQKEIRDSISAFLIAFCLNVLEILSGSLTLTLYELAKRTELQERLRNDDKVEFDLEAIPYLDWQSITRSSLTDNIIEETFQTRPVDPIIRLDCKTTYTSEETKIPLNPGTAVLIPLHVLPDQPSSATSFIVDLETQSFNLFVDRFVRICLKASVTSLLQQYVFDVHDRWTDQDDGVTSCRFHALPDRVLLTISRLDKRGKTAMLEKSLRTFHAMQNASLFSLRTFFT